jgi:hypothetical protein
MTLLIAVFGVFILVLGIVGLVQPDRFRGLFTTMDSRTRFIFAVAVRLAMAALFWWLADELRHPQVMRILAVIAAVAAIVILLAGRARVDRLVDWWLVRSDNVLRVSAVFAAAFGAWLAWEAL